MSKAKLAAAKELIEEKRYIEARDLLRTMPGDPTAAKWIEKLNQRIGEQVKAQPYSLTPDQQAILNKRQQAEKQKAQRSRRGCLLIVVFVIGFAYWIGEGANRDAARNDREATAQSTLRIAATSPVAATQVAKLPTSLPSPVSTRPADTAVADLQTRETELYETEPPPLTNTTHPQVQAAQLTQTYLEMEIAMYAVESEASVFDEAAYIRAINEGIALMAGEFDILSVRVANGRPNGGEIVVIISYTTSAETELDLLREWLRLFSAVTTGNRDENLEIDSISVIIGLPNGNTSGIVTTSTTNLSAFYRGEININEFSSRLVYADL